MPVDLNFNRVTMIVRNYLLDRFQNDYAASYNSIINKYTQNNNGIFIRKGPNKVKPRYPMIAIEAKSMTNQWVAINYFKEYNIELYIDLYVKALGANPQQLASEDNDTDAVSILEDEILELSEFTQQILNDPDNVRFELTLDQNGDPLPQDKIMFCNTSWSESADFQFMYEGPIRAARLTWSGTIQRSGREGKWLDINIGS